MAKKYVYYFGDGKAEGTSNMKELLPLLEPLTRSGNTGTDTGTL